MEFHGESEARSGFRNEGVEPCLVRSHHDNLTYTGFSPVCTLVIVRAEPSVALFVVLYDGVAGVAGHAVQVVILHYLVNGLRRYVLTF